MKVPVLAFSKKPLKVPLLAVSVTLTVDPPLPVDGALMEIEPVPPDEPWPTDVHEFAPLEYALARVQMTEKTLASTRRCIVRRRRAGQSRLRRVAQVARSTGTAASHGCIAVPWPCLPAGWLDAAGCGPGSGCACTWGVQA